MRFMLFWILSCLVGYVYGELLLNGGFESLDHWMCSPAHCQLTGTKYSGQHAVEVSGRQHLWEGPGQYIQVTSGELYRVSGYMKLLNDHGSTQRVRIEVAFTFADGTREYKPAAEYIRATAADGWIRLTGSFAVPDKQPHQTRLYFEGPDPGINFLVDEASVTHVQQENETWRADTDHVINRLRKSDIHLHVTTASNINKADVQIHILQKKKSFPFGTAFRAPKYNDPANQQYRDFLHRHFNWAVLNYYLKWRAVEPQRGQSDYQTALEAIHRLKRHGLKVRGHCLVWSVERNVPDWVKSLQGDELQAVVKQHIEEEMNVTRGLLEHWDVNNENLHGQWFQDRLHDPDYNLELFRIAHNADPSVKLFLNDYGVAYLAQAKQFKSANVGLYGIGVQSHFGNDIEPNPYLIKERLDMLSQAGVPIWVTELTARSPDEDRRADYMEKALRALYGHPAVEGILFWGFDEHMTAGEETALATGDNLDLTAAGHRVLDLLENQWMTDETLVLSQSGNQFTVRGFHGDYEIHVIYKGLELTNLKKTFSLGKADHTVNINVHT